MAPARIEIRRDLFPLVVTTPSDDATLEDYDAMFEFFAELYRRGERFVSVADTRAIRRVPSAMVRRRISEFTEKTQAVNKRLTVANYVVVSNALVRGALQALDWVFEPPTPRLLVTSYSAAVRESVDKLVAAGVPISRALREHLDAGAPEPQRMRV